jgi:formylglycine-generating enzyme
MQGPLTISAFRLDKYDVTVGRFRNFVDAWNVGYRPPPGSGKHAYLNGGRGLAVTNYAGSFEPGWLVSYGTGVEPTAENLACNVAATWTPSPSSHENLPVNCVNWYESYAFCIWDGGFLPSDAEWGYAAAGGSEQRAYPWGAAEPGEASEYAFYDCHYPVGITANCNVVIRMQMTAANIAPVGMLPRGAGRWGQLDLEGNMGQRVLDQLPAEPCKDCGYWPADDRGRRGADFASFPASDLNVWNYTPMMLIRREDFLGFRCARAP